MGFMQFSTNPIEGCDLASLRPPNLEHIWGPKWQPVYGLLEITKKKKFRLKILVIFKLLAFSPVGGV